MIEVEHRDCYESLARARDLGGADLVLTSPPYPDARSDEAYGANFDTSLPGYHRLGLAVFEALKPGGVCALNIDGPVRKWRTHNKRGEEVGSERSLIAFRVAIDWADEVGFRFVEHAAYVRHSVPIGDSKNPRHRSGWEPLHIFSRPGSVPFFDRFGSTRTASSAGAVHNGNGGRRRDGGVRRGRPRRQAERRALTTAERHHQQGAAPEHPAPFARSLADDYVLCYCPPDGLVCDPFVGSGTVAYACQDHGRRFVGGDLGARQRDGARWADVVTAALANPRLRRYRPPVPVERQRSLFSGSHE